MPKMSGVKVKDFPHIRLAEPPEKCKRLRGAFPGCWLARAFQLRCGRRKDGSAQAAPPRLLEADAAGKPPKLSGIPGLPPTHCATSERDSMKQFCCLAFLVFSLTVSAKAASSLPGVTSPYWNPARPRSNAV